LVFEGIAMDEDDLPPRREPAADEDSFAGALGLTFTGLLWVAAFAAVAGLGLYAFVHWF
jgi:hypothetical protein